MGWMATGSSLLVNAVDAVRLSPLPNFALRSTGMLLNAAGRDAFVSGTELNTFLEDQRARFEKNLTLVKNTVGDALISPRDGVRCGLFCLVDLKR